MFLIKRYDDHDVYGNCDSYNSYNHGGREYSYSYDNNIGVVNGNGTDGG